MFLPSFSLLVGVRTWFPLSQCHPFPWRNYFKGLKVEMVIVTEDEALCRGWTHSHRALSCRLER